jgi:hypothetical protein
MEIMPSIVFSKAPGFIFKFLPKFLLLFKKFTFFIFLGRSIKIQFQNFRSNKYPCNFDLQLSTYRTYLINSVHVGQKLHNLV